MDNLILAINSGLNSSLQYSKPFFNGSLFNETAILQLTEKLISSLNVDCPYHIEINNFYFSRHLEIRFKTKKRTFVQVFDVGQNDLNFDENKAQLKIVAPGFYVYINNVNEYINNMTKIMTKLLAS
jgi:hypothetical protein